MQLFNNDDIMVQLMISNDERAVPLDCDNVTLKRVWTHALQDLFYVNDKEVS